MSELWDMLFSNSAEKFVKKLKDKRIVERILKGINELRYGPCSLPYKKLRGMENTYRIRIGDYRVTYEVAEDARIIKILEIGHRQNVYE